MKRKSPATCRAHDLRLSAVVAGSNAWSHSLQGIPAPQAQAPLLLMQIADGRSGWLSHTHPQSWQLSHLKDMGLPSCL